MNAGAIGWTPATFWRSTLTEFFAAIDGWNRAQGGGHKPMTAAEYDSLLATHGGPAKSIRKGSRAGVTNR